MKKLLLLITGLLLLFSVEGQILRYSNYTAPVPPPSGDYCDEYQAVYDAMTSKPSTTNAGYQNAMVDSLVSKGYWTNRMELFYVFAQESVSSNELSINWVAPTGSYSLVDAGSVDPYEHAIQYEGIDANGSDDWLSTNWNPNDNAVNVSVNSFTVGAYVKTEVYGAYAVMGCRDASSHYLRIAPRYNETISLVNINSAGSCNANNTTSLGLFMSTRRAAEEQESYMNGTSLGSDTDASDGMPDYPMAILAYNYNNTKSMYYDGIVSIVFVMNAVSDADVSAINTIIEAYMDAIGEGVQ